MHALVNSRLDYCNSLLSGITDQLLSQLQSVLRAFARLVLQLRKFDPISNDIREMLHWLPIRQRIIYKLCLLVFRCLRVEAPSYLFEMLTPLSGVHHLCPLRSAAHGNLHIPRTRTRTFGPRSFSVSGPSSWNKLPDNLKNIELILQVFKSQLKDSSLPPGLWTITLSGISTSTLAMDSIHNGALYKLSFELN